MSLSVPLYILGSSGYAHEVAAYARVVNPKRTFYFVDSYSNEPGCLTVAEYWEKVASDKGESVMGSGRCEIRRRMLLEITPPFATIVHPTAVVMGSVAPGCVIAPGAVIAPNAQLGLHVTINYNATVGHDTFIQDLSVVGPGAAIGGWCQLHEAVYIGAGALVREKLTVEQDAVIGMGAVVTKNVPPDMVAIGVPALFKVKDQCGQGWLT